MNDADSTTSSAPRRWAALRRLLPRRGWLQISLRTLLVLVVAACVSLAWLSDRARRQERLVKKVIAAGGFVNYCHQLDASGKRTAANPPPGPAWLRRLVGDHYFLEIRSIGCNSLDDNDLKQLANYNQIDALALGERHTDRGIQYLSGLKNLRAIDMDGLALTDESLKVFAQFPKLETLAVTGAQFTDEGLMHLARAKNLRFLAILETCVTEAGVNRLKESLPNLEIHPRSLPSSEEESAIVARLIKLGARLNADDNGYLEGVRFLGATTVDSHLAGLEQLTRLKVLWLHQTSVSDAAIAELLAACPKVRVMPPRASPIPEEEQAWKILQTNAEPIQDRDGYVKGVIFRENVPDRCIEALSSFSRLTRVSMLGQTVTPAQIIQLSKLITLEELSIERASLSNDDVRQLGKLHGLKTLRLHGSGINDEALAYLQGMTGLQTLRLSGAAITGAGFARLENLADLQVLMLQACQIDNDGLREIGKLTRLTKLFLNANDVTDEGIEYLAPLSNLDTLSLEHTDVSDAAVPSLSKLNTLRSLRPSNTRVTSAGRKQLKQALPKCRGL